MKASATRAMRRRGHRDGGAIAGSVIRRMREQAETHGSVTPEMEDEALNLLTNKVGRAVLDLKDEGVGQSDAEQYYFACIAECTARLREHQARFAAAAKTENRTSLH